MRRRFTQLFPFLILCLGCGQIQALFPLVANPLPDGGGGTLDVSEWALVEVPALVEGAPVAVAIHNSSGGAIHAYDFPVLIDPTIISMRSISVNSGGILATVTWNGVVALSRLGVAEVEAQRAMGARAGAWSNAGDRIAVVTLNEQNTLKLEIVDPALESLQQRAIDLPREVAFDIDGAYCVSWSPDDDQLAVSTDRFSTHIAGQCIVLDLSGDRVDRYGLSNVYFLGPDLIVGNEEGIFVVETGPSGGLGTTSIPGPLNIMRIAAGEIVSRSLVANATVVTATYLDEGIYVTREAAQRFDLGPVVFAPIRVRHVDGRASAILGPMYLGYGGTFLADSQMALMPRNGVLTTE